MKRSIWIGFDPREASAYAVTRHSIERNLTKPIPIRGVVLRKLQAQGLYKRRTLKRLGKLWDTISEAPMSTEFAISRFLVPHLAGSGLALFLDCDMLVRGDLVRLFDKIEYSGDYAVWCVKHNHRPDNDLKMDGQEQTRYARKNWSSFMVFNCDHPSNRKLTVDLVNSVPGRDLHRFCWLQDDEIGELGPEWNCLVGHTNCDGQPTVVHFTDGGPWFTGFENIAYADEWRKELDRWAE
jgi:lipopolysaccharide biosynthesis glycosyltransferase